MQQKLIINRLYSLVCHPSSVISRLSSVVCPLHLSRTLYKSALFMQNKPNLVRRRRIADEPKVLLKKYLWKKCNWTLGQNKPNSNPIKAKTKPISEKPRM